jgi:hypothetical protein
MFTLILIAAALFLVSEVVAAACSTNVTNDPELRAELEAYHHERNER